MNFESNKEKELVLDEENEMKCYPKVSNNQMPYQKIEKEIRLNKQWPPITEINEMSNGVVNRNVSSPMPPILSNGQTNSTTESKNNDKSEEITSF